MIIMKAKIISLYILTALMLVLATTLTQAILIKSVTSDKIYPGTSGDVVIGIKNDAGEDIEGVSLSLDLSNSPFTSISSTEQGFDEILDDKSKNFLFELRANNDAKPGSYNIPYTLTYDTLTIPKKGSIGVLITGDTDLEYSIIQETNVIGSKGKIDLKIVNKGFGEAKFLDVKIQPQGFTLLSEPEIYIGTIDSDDFQTASFDVVYKSKLATLNAVVTYKDFDNKEITKNLELPLIVYSQEQAKQLGITKSGNSMWIIILIIVGVVIFLIRRNILRKRRLKRNELAMR